MNQYKEALQEWLEWYEQPELMRHQPPVSKTKELLKDTSHIPADFNEFWEVYGYKVKRLMAQRAWGKLSMVEREQAVKAIPAYRAYLKRTGISQAHPSTYINQRYWDTDWSELNTEEKSRYPDTYDREYERRLTPDQMQLYWRHLRQLGWRREQIGNGTFKWVESKFIM